MNATIRRVSTVLGSTAVAVGVLSGTALAHECVNLNKKPLAGAQVVFGSDGETMKKGVEKRVEKGLIDPETGDGLRGLIGIEEDGFAVTTWSVTPTGSIPLQAQQNGSECNGVIDFEAAMGCLAG